VITFQSQYTARIGLLRVLSRRDSSIVHQTDGCNLWTLHWFVHLSVEATAEEASGRRSASGSIPFDFIRTSQVQTTRGE
jgi:hypothetical protein